MYSNRNELKEAVDIVDNDFGHNTAFRCTCHSSFTVKSFKYCHLLHGFLSLSKDLRSQMVQL